MKWRSKEVVFIIFSLASLAIATFGFLVGPAELPIWYSLSVPEQQIDQKAFLFVFPVSIIVIALLHTFFIRLTKTMDPTLGRIVLWASLIPVSILFIALIHVVIITI